MNGVSSAAFAEGGNASYATSEKRTRPARRPDLATRWSASSICSGGAASVLDERSRTMTPADPGAKNALSPTRISRVARTAAIATAAIAASRSQRTTAVLHPCSKRIHRLRVRLRARPREPPCVAAQLVVAELTRDALEREPSAVRLVPGRSAAQQLERALEGGQPLEPRRPPDPPAAAHDAHAEQRGVREQEQSTRDQEARRDLRAHAPRDARLRKSL